MLSEVVKAQIEFEISESRRKHFSGSMISACPMETFINFHRLNPREKTGNVLVLEDGHWQEAAMVSRLKRAGFTLYFTLEDQLNIFVGKSKIPGHPDGFIEGEALELSMLEFKGMNNRRFKFFVEEGLEPSIEGQVQTYLSGRPLGVETCIVYARRKETAEEFDRLVERSEEYAREVIGNTDEIVLGKWEPKPKRDLHCSVCRHEEFCFGNTPIVDFSKSARVELQQKLVEKLLLGKMKRDSGKEIYEEAKQELGLFLQEDEAQWFPKAIFDSGEITIKVARQTREETRFDRMEFVRNFGADRLPLVMRQKVSSFIVCREISY